VGGSLVRAVASRLAAAGTTSLLLWVFEANAQARTFYEALGGIVVPTQPIDIAGQTLTEVAYGSIAQPTSTPFSKPARSNRPCVKTQTVRVVRLLERVYQIMRDFARRRNIGKRSAIGPSEQQRPVYLTNFASRSTDVVTCDGRNAPPRDGSHAPPRAVGDLVTAAQ